MRLRKRRGASLPESAQWHAAADGQARLQSDLAMVATEFPSLKFSLDKDNYATLTGTIAVNIGKGHEIIREANVTVLFDRDYPQSEPDGFIAKGTFYPRPGKLFADRHMSKGGWCCLELPAESSWDAKDPDGLRKWLTNFVLFVHRQFLYDINDGVWPGPEWEHGSRGWAQFVLEKMNPELLGAFVGLIRGARHRRKDACPCGSGKRFAPCHKRELDQLLSVLPNDLRQLNRIADILEDELAEPNGETEKVVDAPSSAIA